MPDLLITRPPSPEESARAAHRQDEDDRLNAANIAYRHQVAQAIQWFLDSDDFKGESLAERVALRSRVKRIERTLTLFGASAIVAPYARALREQAETITRREQDGEQ